MKKRQAAGAILALAGGICWGVSGSIGQYAFTHLGMSSAWLVPIRLFLAGLIMMIWNLFRYRGAVFAPWKDRKDTFDLLIYSLPGIGLCQLTYFTTIQLSTAGVATILQDLSPVPILLVTCWQARRKPNAPQIISVLLAMVGAGLITTHGKFGTLSVSGSALATGLICALTVALYNLQPVRLLNRHPLFIVQGWAFLLSGSLFLLIFHPLTSHYTPNLTGLLCIAGVVVIGNLMAFPFYMAGVTMIGGTKANLYGFSEPVTAAIIGTLLLGGTFTIFDAIGFGCIFLMMVLISASSPQKNAAKTASPPSPDESSGAARKTSMLYSKTDFPSAAG